MIKITYDNGEMNIDPVAFVLKHTMADTRFLIRKVVKIAYNTDEVIAEFRALLCAAVPESERDQARIDRALEELERICK